MSGIGDAIVENVKNDCLSPGLRNGGLLARAQVSQSALS